MSKNILIIIASRSGTIAKVSYNLYKGLCNESRYKIYVCSVEKHFSNNQSTDFPLKEIFHTPKDNPFYRTLYLYRLKRKLGIDISISTQIGCNIWNVLSSKKDFTVGIFHAPVSQHLSASLVKYFVVRILYIILFPFINLACGVSETVYRDLYKIPFTKKLRLYNIHSFDVIQNKALSPVEPEILELMGAKNILYVGGIFNVKAPERAIHAFNILQQKISYDVRLLIVGDGDSNYLKKTKDLVTDLQLEDKIIFLGHLNNPYKLMRKCDVLVSPSKSEGLPGVIIEALFLGKPVVASNSSIGVWEIMQCESFYNGDLSSNYKTRFGYITPNVKNNELLNIQKLAEALFIQLQSSSSVSDFNYERFCSKNIINQLSRHIEVK